MKCSRCRQWLLSWTKREVDTGLCPSCRSAEDSETQPTRPQDRASGPHAPRALPGEPSGLIVGDVRTASAPQTGGEQS